MLTYSFSKIGSESLYMYLYKCIREDILTGKITPGTKLPSKRSFAENLGVSVITVENAYAQLVSEGYVYALPKKGFFAANLEKAPRRRKKRIPAHKCPYRRNILRIFPAAAPTRRISRLPHGRSSCARSSRKKAPSLW